MLVVGIGSFVCLSSLRMIEHVRLSSSSICGGGGGDAGCVVIDLNKRLPSLLEIHSSCRAIQSKCMPGEMRN